MIVLLELALVRVAQLDQLDDLSQLIQRLDGGEAVDQPPPVKKKIAPPAEARPASGKPKPQAAAPVPRPAPEPATTASSQAAADTAATAPLQDTAPSQDDEPDDLPAVADPELSPISQTEAEQAWRAGISSLNDMSADCASQADGVAISGPNRLVVRFRAMYNSSKAFCERPDRRETLEKAVSSAAGRPLRLEFQTLKEDRAHSTPPEPVLTRQQLKQQATNHPLVARAVEIFDAEIVSVEIGSTAKKTS